MTGVFFFQAEDGIRDDLVTGVQTCALPLAAEREPPLSPASPGADQLLRVSVHAHSNRAPAGAEVASWQEVGRWSQRLSDPQAAPDARILAQARELPAGLHSPPPPARAVA